MSIGKRTRRGVIGSFGKIMGKNFTWMGTFVAFIPTAITFYYTVVTGWGLMLTYAVYSHRKENPILTSTSIGFGNNLASLQPSAWDFLDENFCRHQD